MRPLRTVALLLALAVPARAELGPFNGAGITYGHVHLNDPTFPPYATPSNAFCNASGGK